MARSDTPPDAVKRAIGTVAGGVLDRFMTLFALFFIGMASVFLTVAWMYGPQVLLQAAQYRKYTERVDARIVESWLALDLDISRIRSPAHWRASALASPCVVVEYGGDWGAPIRREGGQTMTCSSQAAINSSAAVFSRDIRS